MSGNVEVSICDVCKKEGVSVARKYYRYLIVCECCNAAKDNHFEIVRYCSDCKPVPPRRISAVVLPLEEGGEG